MRPYQSICSDIEKALHKQLKTPKDFDFLRQSIYARLRIYISQSTLMRLWGYVDEPVAPRISTLDALAQYLGYQHWDDYEAHAQEPGQQQSRPVMNRSLKTKDDLCKGQRLRLTWQPNRICDIEYLGDLTFQVLASENTRLLKGDTFECWLFIEGEPLYLAYPIPGVIGFQTSHLKLHEIFSIYFLGHTVPVVTYYLYFESINIGINRPKPTNGIRAVKTASLIAISSPYKQRCASLHCP